MRHLAILLVLASPLAAAGTAADPEVIDPEGDATPPAGCADITAVWVERDDAGALTFTATVATCTDPPVLPAAYWSIDFETSNRTYYIYADLDREQGWGFWHGPMENGTPTEHFRAPLTYTAGSPATLVMPYPADVATLPEGDELRFVQVVAGAYSSFQDALRFDEATASRSFVPPVAPAEGPTSSEVTPFPWALGVSVVAALALMRRAR